MKTWYMVVCDEHKVFADVFINNPNLMTDYLSKYDEKIQHFMLQHYTCKLRLIQRDDEMDFCFNNGYTKIHWDKYSYPELKIIPTTKSDSKPAIRTIKCLSVPFGFAVIMLYHNEKPYGNVWYMNKPDEFPKMLKELSVTENFTEEQTVNAEKVFNEFMDKRKNYVNH